MNRAGFLDGAVVVALLAASTAMLSLIAVDFRAATQRVDITIRYSQFQPEAINVEAGLPVRFVIRNDDPIEHEWLIGDEQFHTAHRTGTEAHHGARPNEISIPPLATVGTTLTFDEPVTWSYICHLPGHESYGMVGVLTAR